MRNLLLGSIILTFSLTACKKETIITNEDSYSGLDCVPYSVFNYSDCNNKGGQYVIQSLQDFYYVDSICKFTGNYLLKFDSFTYLGASILLNHSGYDTEIKVYQNLSEKKTIVRLIANERYEIITPKNAIRWYWIAVPKQDNEFSIDFIREFNLFNKQ